MLPDGRHDAGLDLGAVFLSGKISGSAGRQLGLSQLQSQSLTAAWSEAIYAARVTLAQEILTWLAETRR